MIFFLIYCFYIFAAGLRGVYKICSLESSTIRLELRSGHKNEYVKTIMLYKKKIVQSKEEVVVVR